MFRTPYSSNHVDYSKITGISFKDKSRARQSEKEEADINTIVRRFKVTGQIPTGVRAPTYGDFGDVFDYQTAMETVLEAQKSFLKMPAETRKRFDNNPQNFVEFCSNRDNLEEMRKMGLAIPAPPKVEEKPPQA